MRRHKWGIWWLVLLAWNSAFCTYAATKGRIPAAVILACLTVLSGVMAYRDLTTRKPGSVTITITPDTRAFDAALKQAAAFRATPRKGGYTGGPKP